LLGKTDFRFLFVSLQLLIHINEAKNRELASLDADMQQLVWDFATHTAPVVDDKLLISAAHLRKALFTVEILKQNGWNGDLQPERALLIDPEFHEMLPAIDPPMLAQIEACIIELGVLQPLVIWGKTILDGHVRYFICMRHELPFETRQMPFMNRQEAESFILRNQSGLHNYTPEQIAEIEMRLTEYEAGTSTATM